MFNLLSMQLFPFLGW